MVRTVSSGGSELVTFVPRTARSHDADLTPLRALPDQIFTQPDRQDRIDPLEMLTSVDFLSLQESVVRHFIESERHLAFLSQLLLSNFRSFPNAQIDLDISWPNSDCWCQ